MKYRATISFTGAITMSQNEVREVSEEAASDLISCGYLECMTIVIPEGETASDTETVQKGETARDTETVQKGETTSDIETVQEGETTSDTETVQKGETASDTEAASDEIKEKTPSKPKPIK